MWTNRNTFWAVGGIFVASVVSIVFLNVFSPQFSGYLVGCVGCGSSSSDTAVCNNTIREGSEQCDLGPGLNGAAGYCCSATCQQVTGGGCSPGLCHIDPGVCGVGSMYGDPGNNTVCSYQPTTPTSGGGNWHENIACTPVGGGTGTCTDADTCTPDGSVCGNGTLEPGEVCESSGGVFGSCCDATTCQYKTAATVCRAQNGACDVAETCSGSSATCPVNTFEPATTVCRAQNGLCDREEKCNGTSGTCPADSFQLSGTVCRAAVPGAGAVVSCDLAEVCSGTGTACPADIFKSAATVCRTATDVCDAVENCTGSTATCPADAFQPPATVCRAQNGACDVAESCTGSSVACPANAFAPVTTVCRTKNGLCDKSESCNGTSGTCPADVFEPNTVDCRPAADICDRAEKCSGAAGACPADTFQSNTFVCRAGAGVCDNAERCTGTGIACPADAFKDTSTVCRTSAGVCDPVESCSGSAANCPQDAFSAAGTVCRAQNGACDVAEACSGNGAACPANAFQPGSFVCAALVPPAPPSPGPLSVAGKHSVACNGTSGTCPTPTNVPIAVPTIVNKSDVAGAAIAPFTVPTTDGDGDTPYNFAATNLPVGLSIDAATGVISGTPTATGTRTVTITARDGFGGVATRSFSWAITPPASSASSSGGSSSATSASSSGGSSSATSASSSGGSSSAASSLSSSSTSSASSIADVACPSGSSCLPNGTPRPNGTACPVADPAYCPAYGGFPPSAGTCVVGGCAGVCYQFCPASSSSSAQSSLLASSSSGGASSAAASSASSCAGLQPSCGNRNLEGVEQCDDGNATNGDGCTLDCRLEAGWQCLTQMIQPVPPAQVSSGSSRGLFSWIGSVLQRISGISGMSFLAQGGEGGFGGPGSGGPGQGVVQPYCNGAGQVLCPDGTGAVCLIGVTPSCNNGVPVCGQEGTFAPLCGGPPPGNGGGVSSASSLSSGMCPLGSVCILGVAQTSWCSSPLTVTGACGAGGFCCVARASSSSNGGGNSSGGGSVSSGGGNNLLGGSSSGGGANSSNSGGGGATGACAQLAASICTRMSSSSAASSSSCPALPQPVCGNGSVDASEQCDDRNTLTGDGCSSSCAVERGWQCPMQASQSSQSSQGAMASARGRGWFAWVGDLWNAMFGRGDTLVAQVGGACRQLYAGVATTVYSNGQTDSVSTRITFPASCANPVVSVQTYKESILCSNTGNGATNCGGTSRTSTDLFARTANVTSDGFDVNLHAGYGVWAGASSPQFQIGWIARCGDPSLPLCPSPALITGSTTTRFFNGDTNSIHSPVTFTTPCANPAIIGSSTVTSLQCASGQGCTTTPVHPYIIAVTPAGFTAGLSAANPVNVGAVSPLFPVTWEAVCEGGGTSSTASSAPVRPPGNNWSAPAQPASSAGACSASECGTRPPLPNYLCSDGSLAGPGQCVRGAGGTCSWQVHICPAPSSSSSAASAAACPIASGSACKTFCGDGIKAGTEQCDDRNSLPGDGCSSVCIIEGGWQCTVTGISSSSVGSSSAASSAGNSSSAGNPPGCWAYAVFTGSAQSAGQGWSYNLTSINGLIQPQVSAQLTGAISLPVATDAQEVTGNASGNLTITSGADFMRIAVIPLATSKLLSSGRVSVFRFTVTSATGIFALYGPGRGDITVNPSDNTFTLNLSPLCD